MRSILEDEAVVENRQPQLQHVELQHLNLKLLLKVSGVSGDQELDLDPIIPIFHGWIQNQVFDELLLDVADYRHVPNGPGVVLIGHEADYSIDNTDGRLGVRYNRKAVVDGSNQERLEQATRAVLHAAKRLEEDASLQQKLRFSGRDIEVSINDRLLAPNCEDTGKAVEPDLRTFFGRLFGGDEYSLSYSTDATKDSRRLFGASVSSGKVFSLTELLENLGPRRITY
jgi:hypothetical protein